MVITFARRTWGPVRRRAGSWIGLVCAGAALTGLAACQGDIGNGGMSMPQQPAPFNNPQGPGSSNGQSRQRVVEGAVFLEPDRKEIPLPDVDGYAVALELSSPAPSSSPAAGKKATKASGTGPSTHGRAGANSGTGFVGSAGLLAAAQAATASPLPVASGSPGASPAPSPVASGSATKRPASAPSPGAKAPKIATKTTIYPDAAPAAPSPQPSGDVQTYGTRTPIIRGYVLSAVPLHLYGLGAVRFTIPSGEEKSGRGFTIAVFEEQRHHHSSLMGFDANAQDNGGTVSVSDTQPLVLKKETGYVFMLYGDELAPTPGPGYPTPGNNPFPAPSGYATGAPGYPQQPGMPVQPGGYTPNPYGTPYPYGSPNPYATRYP